MNRPYGIMSDLHAHNWSAFARTGEDGINTRLAHIVAEMNRCAHEVTKIGGNRIVIAGDMFHTRGAVSPSVFNPVKEMMTRWVVNYGVNWHIIPGNHDLETRNSRALNSAVAMLETEGVITWHEPSFLNWQQPCVVIPWQDTKSDLIAAISKTMADVDDLAATDLLIHAGIDGVLKGVPDHGLTAKMLGDFGFKRVFAGHYHHHVELGHNVWSIGSPTHQTWSDVGTKSGWLIAHDDRVQWFASHAPNFIEITGEEDPAELELEVDGQFVRLRLGEATAAEVSGWRTALQDMGAAGVTIEAVPKTGVALRGAGTSTSIDRLDQAILEYATSEGLSAEVTDLAMEIFGAAA